MWETVGFLSSIAMSLTFVAVLLGTSVFVVVLLFRLTRALYRMLTNKSF